MSMSAAPVEQRGFNESSQRGWWSSRIAMMTNPGAGIAGASARSRIGPGVRARRCA